MQALPLAALVATAVALTGRAGGLRRGFLYAMLVCGAYCVLLTEALSLFAGISRASLAAGWGGLASAAAWFAWRDRAAVQAALRPPELDRSQWAGAVASSIAIAAILAGAAVSAILGTPNMADVLTYHMPRILFWAQHGSVGSYPTPNYQELSMPPFSEYAMLQIYVLGDGDWGVGLAQLAAFAGAIVAASASAARLGAGFRGQWAAALVCATLPSAILQSSGAKPDVTMGAWLAVAAWAALEAAERFEIKRALALGAGLGLCLLTKGTAYLFAPPMLLALWASAPKAGKETLARSAAVAAIVVVLLNAGYWGRNWAFNGKPLGDGTINGDGDYTYANARFGMDVFASNVIRNAVLQLVFRQSWNERIHAAAVGLHERLGIDENDPATTWMTTSFQPPAYSMHEALAPNVRHLLLLGPTVLWLLYRRRLDAAAWLLLGLVGGFLAFCFYLKWQPWHARMHLPLFLAAAPVVGLFLGSLRPRTLGAAALVWLVWNARTPVRFNSLRPLEGRWSVLHAPRDEAYLVDHTFLLDPVACAQDLLRADSCRRIGIDRASGAIIYPILARLRDEDRAYAFGDMDAMPGARRYAAAFPFDEPCAVICYLCGERREERWNTEFAHKDVFGELTVFSGRR